MLSADSNAEHNSSPFRTVFFPQRGPFLGISRPAGHDQGFALDPPPFEKGGPKLFLRFAPLDSHWRFKTPR